jgi:diguanylate cyclase (GGDEF)-like protein
MTLASLPVRVLSQPDPSDAALARIEAIAARQPARAQAELDALDLKKIGADRKLALRVELARLVIADAQSRAEDVLALAGRLQAEPGIGDDPHRRTLLEHLRFDAYYQLDRLDESGRSNELELQDARRSKDDDALSQALLDRARQLMRRGDYEQSCAAIGEAERHARSAQMGAEVSFSNGIFARRIGDWPLALRSYEEANQRFHAVDDRTGEADSKAGAGSALNELGRPEEAVKPLMEAIEAYRQVGDREGEGIAVGELALSHARLDRTQEALSLSREAIDQLAKIGSALPLAHLKVERAGMLLVVKRPLEALKVLTQVRPGVRGSDDLGLQARYYRTSAETQAALGHFDAAYQDSQRSLAAHQRHTEQLVARQLAAQRGRLESELLSRENDLLRTEAEASQRELAAAQRASRLQIAVIGLAALIIVGVVAALWRQRALLRRIARMAETDPLTGVANRRHIIEIGQRLMNRVIQGGRPYSLLLLDLDRFKQINDQHGHAAGDAALCTVSHALRRHLRPEDQLGRWGGEEFAVILPGADLIEAAAVGERLRAAVESLVPDWAPGAEPLTMSGGIAVSRPGHGDFSQLLVRADKALYCAKNAGRNRIEVEPDGA